MDHAQGRAFHHHLARAIMHLNYLAGLLPFFVPSIECDDPSTEHHPRSGCSNPAPRTLHTFVPLPVSSTPPTMVSHGGIPTHMVLNPEPNLRPLTIYTSGKENNTENAHHPREEDVEVNTRNPTSRVEHRFMKPPSGTDQYQISLVQPLEPQYLFRFGQNKDPIRLRIRNRRQSSE